MKDYKEQKNKIISKKKLLRWEDQYDRIIKYQNQRNGIIIFNKDDNEILNLYNWYRLQIRKLKSLTLEQRQKIETLEDTWSRKKGKQEKWESNFQKIVELWQYHSKNKHNTKFKLPAYLYSWYNHQLANINSLSDYKISKLKSLDHNILNKPGKNILLENYVQKILEFKKNSPKKVPVISDSKDERIAFYCYKKIREKKNDLTVEQIERLDSVGFEWERKTKKILDWEIGLNKFAEFKKNNPNKMPSYKNEYPLFYWCQFQKKKRDSLLPEQIEKLNQYGFVLNVTSHADRWENTYNTLVVFKENNPRKMPSTKNIIEKKLHGWCLFQRQKKDLLSQEQIEKLNKIGFEWKSPISAFSWDIRFNKFEEFFINNQRMPRNNSLEEEELFNWCRSQKDRKYKMSDERIAKLTKAGFDYSKSHVSSDIRWENKYNDFLEFRINNPGKYPKQLINGKSNPLAIWCSQQQNDKDKLSQEKIDKLNTIGFKWEKLNKTELWEKRLLEYVEYKKKNNGKNPTAKVNGKRGSLHSWCMTQRNNKKTRSVEKIKKLDEAGFDWIIIRKNHNLKWNNSYNKLVEFKKIHPDRMPSGECYDEYLLYFWCQFQISKKDSLPIEQFEKLDIIGFDWKMKKISNDKYWEMNFKEFLRLKNNNPDTAQTKYIKSQDRQIYQWSLYNQQNKDKLSLEKIEKLNNEGFEWEKKLVRHSWESYFTEFDEFIKNNSGKMPKKNKSFEEDCLYRWCNLQRNNSNKLSHQKIERLTEAGFNWEIIKQVRDAESTHVRRKSIYAKWRSNLEEFIEFAKNNPGQMPAITSGIVEKNLVLWCNFQNNNKRNLLSEQIEMLTNAGFIWSEAVISKQDIWEARLNEYVEFVKKYPFEKLPEQINGKVNPLYTWCYNQRKQKNKLSPEKIEMLNNAGFVWELTSVEMIWEKNYLEFREFTKKNPGKMPVRRKSFNQDHLSGWCRWQLANKNKLTPEQIKKLDDAGFFWGSIRDLIKAGRLEAKSKFIGNQWKIHLNELLEFIKNNPGRMPLWSRINKENNSLADWCTRQRKYRNDLLPEKIEMLKTTGFPWDEFYKPGKLKWEDGYNMYIDFIKNNPRKTIPFMVDGKYFPLKTWFNYNNKNKANLSDEKIERLNAIGFKWEPK